MLGVIGNDLVHIRTHREFLYLIDKLDGGFNPFEKYARQIGSFLQVGMNIKNV